jgi:hypothetical protein
MSTPTTALPAKRGRIGAPTKFCAEIVEKICGHIADGMPIAYTAALCGLSHETVYSWQRKYPPFRAAVEGARAKGLAQRLSVIKTAAKTDWRAAAWYCEHVFPESFAKSRIQLEHVGMVTHDFAVPREVLDSIASARQLHEADNGK